uniref:RNA-directed RNA polymerase n=1 Tax=Pisingos virus TaxID=2689339 RepID=A0A6B9KGM3_9VIRU|nr:RdRp [Pisingos virus]
MSTRQSSTGSTKRSTVTSPFVTDLINDLLVSRRVFSGLFVFGNLKRYVNIVNKFSVTRADCLKGRERLDTFISDLSNLKSRFLNIIKNWTGDRDYSLVRQAVKVGSQQEERVERSPLGGFTHYIHDELKFALTSKKLKAKASVVADGITFFKNFNPFALSKLQRFSKATSGFGAHSTFMKPLIFYYKTVLAVKNTDITSDLLSGIILCVNELTKASADEGLFPYIDDMIRQFLSEVDKLTFVLCQNNAGDNLVYASLHGLSTIGGPRGWTDDSVLDNLRDWVTGTREFPYETNPFVNHKLESWMRTWSLGIKQNDLGFSDFVSDPMRWATGGGAKKKKMKVHGVEVEGRNKWFWALSGLANGEDLYSTSLLEGNDANVALKEEAKTRCVITTPQSSYLRQCYILYRFGTPRFLRSTLADPSLVNALSSTRKDHFICIDSSSFDHNVSKSWILKVLGLMASVSDGELREVVLTEIEAIRDMNIIYNKTAIPYENGLLSGWRMTSLLGSLLSALVCEFINHKLKIELPYIVQGDDIIMMCPRKMDADRILGCCEEFGITTNKKKTTIGRYGEFLKYRYGYGRVQGYAARSVRSIFYANPWLDQTATSTPSEVSGKWWTLLSRLMNTHNGLFKDKDSMDWFVGSLVDDVTGWMGHRASRSLIRDAINTPVSMGGLGVFEFADINMVGEKGFHTKVTCYNQANSVGDEKFISLFAPDVSKKVGTLATRTFDIKKVLTNFKSDLSEFKTKFYNVVNTRGKVVFDTGTNIFRTILTEIASCRNYPPMVDKLLAHVSGPCATLTKPRFLEKANRWFDIARWLTGATMKAVCPPSLFVDTRYDNELVSSLTGVAVTMFMNLPNVTARSEYLISVFAFSRFCQTKCILHAL